MASAAIFLTIIIPIAFVSGFRIESARPNIEQFSADPAIPPVDYRTQPIAGYPKVPPPNAHESGGSDGDLLPPFEHQSHSFRRSVEDAKVDPKTGNPLLAEPSWKKAGGNDPLEDTVKTGQDQEAVDPKTGYPLLAQPHWKDAGGDGEIIDLPLEDTEDNFGQKKEAVDPKTGYPLKANPGWKDAGGDGEILDPPVEDLPSSGGVDPKTGYPLLAEDSWKDAGGDGEILEPPLEEPKEAVDPKTGYPLLAQPGWKDAGGDGDILELPVEEPKEAAVDPKTGYPLVAEESWKYAGGDGNILQLPLEDPERVPVDPKTGYPLIAQPGWKEAGGNGDILQAPLQQNTKLPSANAMDSKTGYPLIAQPQWKDAGGNEDILELPLQQPNVDVGIQERLGKEGYNVIELYKLTELQLPPLEKNLPTIFSNSFSTPSPYVRKQDFAPVQNQKGNSLPSQTQFGINNDQRQIESSYTYVGPENVVVTVTRYLNTVRQEKLNHQSNSQRNGFNRQNNFQKSFNIRGGVPAQSWQPNFPQTNANKAKTEQTLASAVSGK